jgi:hypothetical protein
MEIAAAGLAAVVLLVLVVAEPDILDAPFQSTRARVLTFGGTASALVGWIVMSALKVPAAARVVVLGVPFVAVNYWLLSPFFRDEVVREEFAVSIEDAAADGDAPGSPDPGSPGTGARDSAPPAPAGPVLLGSGELRGLARHRASGQAGVFARPDGSQALRLESLDVQNGPDLQVYVVPGADRRSPGGGSLHLGPLRGNIGSLTYDLPRDFPVTMGDWTVLIWCEAFTVEFAAATVPVA